MGKKKNHRTQQSTRVSKMQGEAKSLFQQVERLVRESNRGAKTSRYTYADKMSTFVQFVGDKYKLQHLKNLSDKHLIGYVEWAKSKGYSASTVKNTLSAVRYVHNILPQTRHELSDNHVLNSKLQEAHKDAGVPSEKHELPQRQFLGTGKNVGWSDAEYQRGLDLAAKMGRRDVELAIRMSRNLGLRIHEITRTERSQLINGLNHGYLTVKGKGGLIRDIQVDSKAAHDVLRDALQQTRMDKQKVFVEKLGTTHKKIASIESWLYRHRSEIADSPERHLTMHGLRHMYAQEQYAKNLIKCDGDEKAARALTAQSLGHGRDWVTKIYLD